MFLTSTGERRMKMDAPKGNINIKYRVKKNKPKRILEETICI